MSYIEERIYLPDNMTADHPEAHGFMLSVSYRGDGKWVVQRGHGRPIEQMTHTGKLLYVPLKMTQMRWCRFTFEEACALAEQHINEVKVNGRTWAQWQEHWQRTAV